MKVVIEKGRPIETWGNGYTVALKADQYIMHVPDRTPDPLNQTVEELTSIVRRMYQAKRDLRKTCVNHKAITAALFIEKAFNDVTLLNHIEADVTRIAAEHKISRIDLVHDFLGVPY